jgi:hypothetical protein
MHHKEFLGTADGLVDERGKEYGDLDANFYRITSIFRAMTGVDLSPREAALFLLAVKLARLRTSPRKPDTYLDGINYLAFAGQFATEGK